MTYLLPNTNELFRLHGQIRKADILCIDPDICEVEVLLELDGKILRHIFHTLPSEKSSD